MTRRACGFPDCGRSLYGNGLCKSHYAQQWRGVPLSPIRPLSGTVPLEERFWSKVQRGSSCWEWNACKLQSGYGSFKWNGRARPAHVVSYEITHGPVPKGMILDHICRVRSCVRPSHLRPVTDKQNGENRDGSIRNPLPRGVSRMKKTGKYRARVIHNWECHYLGQFDTPESAAAAALAKRNELYTHNDSDRRAA